MATPSSTLAWTISWMGEPGGLSSMRLQSQTGLSELAAAAAAHHRTQAL